MDTTNRPFRAFVLVLVATLGCYSSSVGDDDEDARDVREADARPDTATDVVDARPDAPADALDPCRPQEAWEDPDVDCDMCNPCDPTPVIWVGDNCVYQPICCRCAGPDCDNLFATLDECYAAYRDCPLSSREPPEFMDARLAWQAPGGFAGTGPVLAVDGWGSVRIWEADRGFYSLDDAEWDRTDQDYSENIGGDGADELFRRLSMVDYSALPHPPGPFMECYPLFLYRPCTTCGEIRLDYGSAADLLPEMRAVYDWLDERLCRGPGAWTLPSDYCMFDL